MSSFQDFLDEQMEDEAFRTEYEALDDEFSIAEQFEMYVAVQRAKERNELIPFNPADYA